jgi:hypothetical protein
MESFSGPVRGKQMGIGLCIRVFRLDEGKTAFLTAGGLPAYISKLAFAFVTTSRSFDQQYSKGSEEMKPAERELHQRNELAWRSPIRS